MRQLTSGHRSSACWVSAGALAGGWPMVAVVSCSGKSARHSASTQCCTRYGRNGKQASARSHLSKCSQLQGTTTRRHTKCSSPCEHSTTHTNGRREKEIEKGREKGREGEGAYLNRPWPLAARRVRTRRRHSPALPRNGCLLERPYSTLVFLESPPCPPLLAVAVTISCKAESLLSTVLSFKWTPVRPSICGCLLTVAEPLSGGGGTLLPGVVAQ